MHDKVVPVEASKPLFHPKAKRGGELRPLTHPWVDGYQYFKRPDGVVYAIPKCSKTEIERRMAKGHVPLDDKLRPLTQRGTK